MGQIKAFAFAEERQADRSAELLRLVERQLIARGVRTLLVRKVSLKLRAPRPALPGGSVSARPEYHAPELDVFGAEGTQVATVVVGSRSGCYVVSVKGGMETVDRPEQVVRLLAAHGLPMTGEESPAP